MVFPSSHREPEISRFHLRFSDAEASKHHFALSLILLLLTSFAETTMFRAAPDP